MARPSLTATASATLFVLSLVVPMKIESGNAWGRGDCAAGSGAARVTSACGTWPGDDPQPVATSAQTVATTAMITIVAASGFAHERPPVPGAAGAGVPAGGRSLSAALPSGWNGLVTADALGTGRAGC